MGSAAANTALGIARKNQATLHGIEKRLDQFECLLKRLMALAVETAPPELPPCEHYPGHRS